MSSDPGIPKLGSLGARPVDEEARAARARPPKPAQSSLAPDSVQALELAMADAKHALRGEANVTADAIAQLAGLTFIARNIHRDDPKRLMPARTV